MTHYYWETKLIFWTRIQIGQLLLLLERGILPAESVCRAVCAYLLINYYDAMNIVEKHFSIILVRGFMVLLATKPL